MKDWILVYDLAKDSKTVELVQKATLSSKHYGLIPEIALFGSEKWWKAVHDGRIKVYEISGTIKRLLYSGHGDWPEVEVKELSGNISRWTRVGEQNAYKEGQQILVQYVFQKTKPGPLGPSKEQKTVIKILLKNDG